MTGRITLTFGLGNGTRIYVDVIPGRPRRARVELYKDFWAVSLDQISLARPLSFPISSQCQHLDSFRYDATFFAALCILQTQRLLPNGHELISVQPLIFTHQEIAQHSSILKLPQGNHCRAISQHFITRLRVCIKPFLEPWSIKIPYQRSKPSERSEAPRVVHM